MNIQPGLQNSLLLKKSGDPKTAVLVNHLSMCHIFELLSVNN